VVGGCKELSAGGDLCLCLGNCRREFFIAADAWKNTRHGVGCNSLLGDIYNKWGELMILSQITCFNYCALRARRLGMFMNKLLMSIHF
jgi:hypothetical protein